MPNLSERPGSEKLLRPGQVQETLGIVASTLWTYVHVRKLLTPATWTAGGHARYRESEVAALKARFREAPTEAAA